MKLYISQEPKRSLKKCFRSFQGYGIIDVSQIKEELGYRTSDMKDTIYSTFVINRAIERKILSCYKSKRFSDALMIVESISEGFVPGLKEYLERLNIFFTEYVLLECSDTTEESMHSQFDRVL